MQCQVFDLLTLQHFCNFSANLVTGRYCSLRPCDFVASSNDPTSFGSRTLWKQKILFKHVDGGNFVGSVHFRRWDIHLRRLPGEWVLRAYLRSKRAYWWWITLLPQNGKKPLTWTASGRNSFISLTGCYKHADSRSILSSFNLAQCIECMNKTPNGLRALVRGQRRKGGGIAWSESTVERLDPPPGSEADSCFSHLVSYTPPHASREFRHVRMTRSGRSLEVRLHQKPRLSYLCCLSTGSIGYLHAHAHHQRF